MNAGCSRSRSAGPCRPAPHVEDFLMEWESAEHALSRREHAVSRQEHAVSRPITASHSRAHGLCSAVTR
jgi:hypothetical protein